MGVADAIAALPITNAGGAFSDLPYRPPVTNNTLQKSNIVIIKKVSVSAPASTNASNRVFAYLESLYPGRFAPANSLTPASDVSKTGSGYYYRYYSRPSDMLPLQMERFIGGMHLEYPNPNRNPYRLGC